MPQLLRAATPVQLLVAGFAAIVLVSAAALSMPFCSTGGRPTPYVDALFMTSSAISTTGLVVADIGRDYTLIGQLLMLVVVQIGGIGYMCFVPLVVVGLAGRRLTIGARMLLRESMARPTWLDMVKFTKVILVATLIIESLGAAVLAAFYAGSMPLGSAAYAGVYHSVNAFCTAGMSIWTTNMMCHAGALVPNLVLLVLMLTGGIGFFVLYDVAHTGKKLVRRESPRALSTHSHLALVVTAVLVGAGTAVLLLSGSPEAGASLPRRALTSLFQTVSASTTTGFNSVDIGALAMPALFVLILLMFVGASPNSTGGGIKTTTLGVTVTALWCVLRGRRDVTLFRRRVKPDTVNAAFGLSLAAVVWVAAVTGVMAFTERAQFDQLLFEVVSAFGNVGLSTGITTSLSVAGKLLLSATMFFGRVGPLAIGFSLIGRREVEVLRYPEADVFVG